MDQALIDIEKALKHADICFQRARPSYQRTYLWWNAWVLIHDPRLVKALQHLGYTRLRGGVIRIDAPGGHATRKRQYARGLKEYLLQCGYKGTVVHSEEERLKL
jgi:hypothetical protein